MAVFVSRLVLLLGLITAVIGSDLPPLLAWSNQKSISEFDSTVDSLLETVETSSVSTVLVFAFDKLSFDDIAKYGGAYGNENEATHLQSAMDSAPFQHYGGIRTQSQEWISILGEKLNKQPLYVTKEDTFDPNNQFIVVKLLAGDGFHVNDAVVGKVMDAIKEDSSYFVIYTEVPSEVKHRRVRSVQLQAVDNDDQPSFVKEDCQIGGQFNYSSVNITSGGDDERACLLFCLSSPIIFVPDASDSNASCYLAEPYMVTNNCSVSMDSNNTEDDILSLNYGKSYPSVTLRYKVVNGTSDDTDGLSRYNNCTQAIWTNFSATEPQSAKKADSHMEVDIELTFFFPKNFTYNGVYTREYWAVMISSVYTERYASSDPTFNRPPDEDLDDDDVVGERTLLIRKDMPGLHQKFLVSTANSYACSASQYSMYTTASYTLNNETLNIHGANVNATSMLNLTFIQVEPYNVSNKSVAQFSAADNCIGYFSEGSWMGIFSMLILIVIFYLAILCVFSMQTIDQYEDPRGQTISIDKLH